jgi:hypothetical protein
MPIFHKKTTFEGLEELQTYFTCLSAAGQNAGRFICAYAGCTEMTISRLLSPTYMDLPHQKD